MVESNVARTPDERFVGLDGYDFTPNYCKVYSRTADLTVRMHYIDEGDRNASETIVCVHGNPHWCYVWRQVLPHFIDAGYRVVCPDNIGCGRSDKPMEASKVTYSACVEWYADLISRLNLKAITWVMHDFGGPLGLRVALHELPLERTSRLVLTNTSFFTGQMPAVVAPIIRNLYHQLPNTLTVEDAKSAMNKNKTLKGKLRMGFGMFRFMLTGVRPALDDILWPLLWTRHLAKGDFMKPQLFNAFTKTPDNEITAYLAPFPGSNIGEDRSQLEQYLGAMRRFPGLLPLFADGTLDETSPEEVAKCQECWKTLQVCKKPLLTAFSDRDPAFKDGDAMFLKAVQGARKTVIKGAGHTAQEGPTASVFAKVVVDFMLSTPINHSRL